jgi:flavin reductase (DIM6/NTAB) family NADH-FMN oxidoreductase RutF
MTGSTKITAAEPTPAEPTPAEPTPAEPTPAEPTPAEWRAAMGWFPSGVTIVTSWRDGKPIGSTVSAFCSVSLRPPMLLVCLDLNNPIAEPLRACGVFGVNVLPEDGGGDAAMHFAIRPEEERFESYPYRLVNGGAPQLGLAPVFVDCVLESQFVAGDHVIIVGRGVRTDIVRADRPLLSHLGGFHKLDTPPERS